MPGPPIRDDIRREHFVTYALLHAGFSPSQIANIVGLSRQTVSARKRGRRWPAVDVEDARSVAGELLERGLTGEELVAALIREAWKRFPAGSKTFPSEGPGWDLFKPDD